MLFPRSVKHPLICDPIVADPGPLTVHMALFYISIELEIVIPDFMVQLDPHLLAVQTADEFSVSNLRADPLRVADGREMPFTGNVCGV